MISSKSKIGIYLLYQKMYSSGDTVLDSKFEMQYYDSSIKNFKDCCFSTRELMSTETILTKVPGKDPVFYQEKFTCIYPRGRYKIRIAVKALKYSRFIPEQKSNWYEFYINEPLPNFN